MSWKPMIGAIALVAAGCENQTPLSSDFGDSVRHNMVLHIIEPDPDYAGREVPSLSGLRATGVITRYEKGEVTKPETVKTSETGGGTGK